jgi:CDP-glycerol glycerophosphotransferase (TagB/SpsB family)
VCIQSTVILEALALEKPVIQLNLTEKYNVFGELANKCIKRVTKESELHNAIKLILYGKSLPERLSKERKKFILEYYYKIDGNSTRRFIDVFRGLLTENEKNKCQ